MKRSAALLPFCASLFAAGLLTPQPAARPAPDLRAQIKPFLKVYCLSCHSGETPAAGLDFSKLGSVDQSSATWTKALQYLASSHMPPASARQPSDSEREAAENLIRNALKTLPGGSHVTMRRLNKAEYTNTIRDLLGVEFKGAGDFPSDDVGYGFDNIGDVLSVSPLLLERYLSAAEQVASAAIVEPQGKTETFSADLLHLGPGRSSALEGEDMVLFSDGFVYADLKPDKGGHYLVKVRAFGDQAGPDPCQMEIRVDGTLEKAVAVSARGRKDAQEFSVPIVLKSGAHQIQIAFTNDYYHPEASNPKDRDRNLRLVSVSVQGPEIPQSMLPEIQQRLLPDHPEPGKELEAAERFFKAFAPRAFRRPATDAEIGRLSSCVKIAMSDGDTFERGIQLGIEAALVSPSFLFIAEPTESGRKLTSYEIASRLSYFLWSSMPDDKLLDLAASGALSKPEVIAREAHRMLSDPKAQALSDNFATQWLTLRKLQVVAPDKDQFPAFDGQMRRDMAKETELFFSDVVRRDGSVLDFLDAKYTFVNKRLADLYGIPNVNGDEFRRVSLEGTARSGVVTQASVLTVTSNPTRTSPVKRGKWVLEELLGTPPPPPPPGVGVLKEDAAFHPATLRERLEEHRKNPACAACHARMDPLGFGLENFDAIGRWRAKDGASKIDSTGQLPDGTKFEGPSGLRSVLDKKKDLFVRCLTEKLFIFGLGRGTTPGDDSTLDRAVRNCADSGYRFSSLIDSIVKSPQFRENGG